MSSVYLLCKKLIALGKTEGLQKKIDVYYANDRLSDEEYTELCEMLHDGDAVAMRGYAKHVTRKGKTDPDFTFYYTDIAKISKIKRKDTAEKKRVELHLHTMMSTMDALIPPMPPLKRHSNGACLP